jgi:murein DD-endopeptidase MepM/ murein hydrolase activator NlpD
MYKQRGRFSQSFVSISLAILCFGAIFFSGSLEDIIKRRDNTENGGSGYLIMAADNGMGGADTLISNSPKGETTEYRVVEGDTISSIAVKFGVSIDTILWENNLKSVDAIKPGQIIKVLPVTGMRHQVRRGETIYSIAKYYSVDAQNIIDYPFNTFSNDETFALTAGQELIVPEAVKPKVTITGTLNITKTVAPIPGVVGEGNFMWPTGGIITQRYSWYHPAVDIANHSNPLVVAAATGTVVTAGWNGGGYGNYIIIDHGNGYTTLYGHLLNNSIIVSVGDKVKQGQKIGTMGSTGRSTGTHLHFEIRSGSGGKSDPLKMLK